MIDLREVRSVTEFQRNIKEYIGRLKRKKTPLVLTVNGRAELVVQDAESYQTMLDRLERAETIPGRAVDQAWHFALRSSLRPWGTLTLTRTVAVS